MSSIRFSGLASGLDTESMVKELMKVERTPVNNLEKDKIALEWKRDAYREVNKSLTDFKDVALELSLERTFLTKTATNSHPNIVETKITGLHRRTQEVEIRSLAKGAFITSSTSLNSGGDASKTMQAQFGISDPIDFNINGHNFTFDPTVDTLNDVITTVNNFKKPDGSDLGVSLSYDSNVDRFFINTKETGSNAQINIIENSGNLFNNALKLDFSSDNDGSDNSLLLTGQDADVTINGANFKMNTNDFTINGINYNLKSASPGTTVTLNVQQDTEAIFDSIKNFVDKYNELIDTLNEKISEERYRSYKPLLEEEMETMTDKQIELWEEKAKSGLLKGDSLVSSIISNLRNGMYEEVSGLSNMINHLSEIGITTEPWESKGKLEINSKDLRTAINEDPEGVMALFTQSDPLEDYSVDPPVKARREVQGVAERIYNIVNDSINSIKDKAGSGASLVDNSIIGKQIKNMDERRESMLDRLQKVEDRYWSQFTALETAMQRMNQQSASLLSLIGQ